jgi:hypothetical protein
VITPQVESKDVLSNFLGDRARFARAALDKKREMLKNSAVPDTGSSAGSRGHDRPAGAGKDDMMVDS